MAKLLSLSGIQTGRPVEAEHVSQSIIAFRGLETYDITVSGSMTINGVTYPETDGASGSVLMTDGAGNATFQSVFTSASYISSSNVDGPFGMDSIQTSSFAFTASTADFATDASASLTSLFALSADSAVSSSYALTASYVDKINSIKFDFVNQTTVPVVHGLGSESIVVQVYEETGSLDPVMILPDDITVNSNNQVTVTLSRPTTGYVTISGGGFLRSGSIQNAQSASWVARTNRTLTQGTGIQAFSFDGSSDATVAFDDTYVVPSASYALTASHALNVPDVAETASYITSSNVDGPFGMDSIQTASYALTASYIDLAETRRFDFVNQTTLFVTHNLDSENVFIQVYQEDAATGNIPTKIVPSTVQLLNNNQARIVFANPTTGFVIAGQSGFIRGGNIESASYALTASYALNAGSSDPIDTGSFYISSSIASNIISFELGDGTFHTQTIESASYAVTASHAITASYVDQIFTERFDFTNVGTVDLTHTLNTEDVIVQVYQNTGTDVRQIMPDDIFVINANLVRVLFAANTTGYAVVTRGGIVQTGTVQTAVTASYVNNTYKQDVAGGTVYAITHNLGEEFPVVQAYEQTTRAQEIPASVVSAGPQSVVVTFATTFAGTIIVKK